MSVVSVRNMIIVRKGHWDLTHTQNLKRNWKWLMIMTSIWDRSKTESRNGKRSESQTWKRDLKRKTIRVNESLEKGVWIWSLIWRKSLGRGSEINWDNFRWKRDEVKVRAFV